MISRLIRDEAVVLRTQPLGEADRIITLLTRRHGKVRASARGVRRTASRFGARLEPFQRVDLQLRRGRSLDVIAQAVTITGYSSRIAEDYDRFTAATAVAETAERLSDEGIDSSNDFYLLVLSALAAIADGSRPPMLLLDSFLLRATASAGWTPQLRTCATCGADGPHVAYDVAAGGVVCSECRRPGAVGVRPRVIEHMIFLLAGDWENVLDSDDRTQNQAAALIASTLTWHLERGIRALHYVERYQRGPQ
ncbi:DNA repair protein RecO [Helcobacillus massiliensis]|uniref:DNA repair protein RecO n=1 Tax=Helcobacillus massiliensis TaxID=521392 RepID=A0A839QPU9_9MICO|nr:DNA repair protein RecO [Helcobacillus massiliensis]MBB3022523.1 DNA repair protein RecO (recombination protein O) [Helcobacillus massiliensis]MCT1557157.1 DNA repair protein RecO [Helcobacillus massiliensis]MCT2036108.1 DNA repair protein RecO [Helcobacillus massiliensis]MCT2331239.1 DNA repair protein RecO [Helcobacillus massiliensis]MDK7741226.1 DNA repair protein RecO [Helcobacillus massiliensis]